MALVACPECGHSVSDMAPTCPACGYPISTGNPLSQIANAAVSPVRARPKTRRRRIPFFSLTVLGVVMGLLGLLLYLRRTDPERATDLEGILITLIHPLRWVLVIAFAIWIISAGVKRGIRTEREDK